MTRLYKALLAEFVDPGGAPFSLVAPLCNPNFDSTQLAMAATVAGDDSILLQFDPLNSPPTSPTSPTSSSSNPRSPGRRRDRDPQSPVAAFFTTVDRSKTLLATVKKKKEQDLIDLGQRQTPFHPTSGRVDLRFGDATFATPLPLSKQIQAENAPGSTPGPVFDPFSPPAAAPTYRSFVTAPQLVIQEEGKAEPSKLIPVETPRAAKPELLVSTAFTPVPANLPNLLNASLSSLYASSTSTASSTKRRRSSIDLDREVHHPDSSFDILRGELEIGTSAEVSFVSSTSAMSVNATNTTVEESPWTMRNTTMSFGGPLFELTPVKEGRDASLLAHEIPLPDSPTTSPESSPIRNADASMHAAKLFPNSRRFSMAPPLDGPLQFPQESPEAASEKKPANHPSTSKRRSMAHTRTMSMTSVTSVGSTQSTNTVRNISPARAKLPQTNKERRETILANKERRDAILADKRSPQISPVSQKNSPSKAAAARKVARPSIALKPTSRLSLMGTGPRASIVPPVRPTPRATAAIAARTGGAAPRPSIASGTAPTTALRGPRPSIASSGRGSMAPPPPPGTKAQPSAEKAKDPALTTGVRANTALRMPRPSITTSAAVAGGAIKKIGGGIASVAKAAATGTGIAKPRPSMMPPLITVVVGRNVDSEKSEPERRRPRTSSAGAALISRPSIGGTGAGTGTALARPSIVGAGPRPSMARPKSVYNMRV